MTALVNVVGFVLSALLAGLFGGVLRDGYMEDYEFAVTLSLGLLSALSTLLFGSLLVSDVVQFWRDYQRLMPALRAADRQGITAIAAATSAQPLPRPRLPQSAFARRWLQRPTRSYEQTFAESRMQGEQRPYRLECRELNRRQLRLAGPYPRPTRLPRQRRKKQPFAAYR